MKKHIPPAVGRVLCALSVLLFILGLCFAPAAPQTQPARAEDPLSEGVLTYELNADGADTVTVTACDKDALTGNDDVANAFTGIQQKSYTITRIGDRAFEDCGTTLTAVTIPASVAKIGDYAFAHSAYDSESKLARVTFEDGSALTEIGEAAFFACVELPGIVLPARLESIGASAFVNCASLASIDIPKSVAVIASGAFLGCEKLASVTFESDSSLSMIRDHTFEDCKALTGVNIPAGVEVIADYAFSGCTELSSVAIPSNAALLKLAPQAFRDCEKLKSVFLPPSLIYIDDDAFASSGPPRTIIVDGNSVSLTTFEIRVEAEYDSYALWWAKQNYNPYLIVPSSGTMRANPPDLMYKYIPYEFIAKTKAPDNEGLRFWLTDDQDRPLSLPEGLYLADGVNPPQGDPPPNVIPGTIYGAPLNYEDFENPVVFTMHAQNIAGGFTASAPFTVALADTPDDAELEASNDYPIVFDADRNADGHIGVWNLSAGKYEITGAYDSVGNYIMYIDGPYDRFDSFWIDGVKRIRGLVPPYPVYYEYTAEEGSTRVTILAQTIQDLDNGEHTAVAAFRRDDGSGEIDYISAYENWNADAEEGAEAPKTNLDITAQRFTVHLTDRPGSGGDPSPGDNGAPTGGDNGGGDNTGGTGETGGTGGTGGTGAGAGEAGAAAGGDAAAAADVADAAETDAAADAAAAADGETAGAEAAAPAGAGAEETGTGAVSGLSADENGRFYFVLDGSGTPMEVRIDIPLEEFEDLYFDGALWSVGGDYAVRSGSTVLTIAAERLERCAAGIHTLSADFQSETAEIVFELIKDISRQEAAQPEQTTTRLPAGEENERFPIPAVTAVIVLILVCGAAIPIVNVRRRKAVK